MKKIVLLLILILLVGCQEDNLPNADLTNDMIEVDLSNSTSLPDHQEEKEDLPLASNHLDGLEYIGSLANGDKIYYKPGGKYFTRLISEQIVAERDQVLTLLSDEASSIPVISPDFSKVAFVKNVGFERLGQLHVYDGQLSVFTSPELEEKRSQNRTIKDCEWYDSDRLLLILGYDSGTITQGGDLYFLSLKDGDLRMVIDAKEGKEIVNASYEADQLYYEVVTWLDKTYRFYDYDRYTENLQEKLNQLPLRIGWEAFNLDSDYLTLEELEEQSWFTRTSDRLQDFERQVQDQSITYDNGHIAYHMNADADKMVQIVIRDFDSALLRNIHTQSKVMDVLGQFPNEENYLKTSDHHFYLSDDTRHSGRLITTDLGFQMIFVVDQTIIVNFNFQGDVMTHMTLDFK